MKFLRWLLGVTRLLRNEEIRREPGVDVIMTRIQEQQLKSYGQLSRMSDGRMVKTIWKNVTGLVKGQEKMR